MEDVTETVEQIAKLDLSRLLWSIQRILVCQQRVVDIELSLVLGTSGRQ